jgi:hypothetical protein
MAFKCSPSFYISLLLAFSSWVVFYPGIFSVDSLVTYREAVSGDFSDLRSSFLTLLFSLFLNAGGQVGLLSLLMCLAGFLGLRRLSLAVLNLFPGSKLIQELTVSGVLVLLASPLTPLVVYLVTFWFDTWLMLGLLWAAALLLELSNDLTSLSYPGKRGRWVGLAILATLILLARPNSILLYPFLSLAFISLPGVKSATRKQVFTFAIFPLLFYLFYIPFQYRGLGVKRAHPERVAVALDLASLLTFDPSICKETPLESCSLIDGFPPGFSVGAGAIDRTLNHGLVKTEPAFASLMVSPNLYQDLWRAASRYPWTYLRVKLLNFIDFIRARERYYYQTSTHPNAYGLHLNLRFQAVRNTLFRWMHAVYQQPLLRYFSFVPLPWMLVNLLLVGRGMLIARKDGPDRYLGRLLLIPLAYSFSYLLAMTAADFRFIYPAVLLVQAISLSRLFLVLLPHLLAKRLILAPVSLD